MGLILINCDLGENESDELTNSLLNSVDAASICCGVHAGSEAKTRKTLEVASEKDVLIGAHPGLPGEGDRGPHRAGGDGGPAQPLAVGSLRNFSVNSRTFFWTFFGSLE